MFEESHSLKDAKWEIFSFEAGNLIDIPVFFFIYNTDNYYHFVWNSLPKLNSYINLCKKKKLKLLMSYPFGMDHHYKFVEDFLSLLNITEEDILIAENATYSNVVFGVASDPKKTLIRMFPNPNLPTGEKLYISRRSWIHGDMSNIGTNYTTRRKCENEDELVSLLTSYSYNEIFPEIMSVKEKLAIFWGAYHIIGPIGGGMVNTIFSDKKSLCIVSPTFLDTNTSFTECLSANYFTKTYHTEQDEFKKYMRVQTGNVIGEIIHVGEDLTISYNEQKISGFNAAVEFKTMVVKRSDCRKLDNGLNSSWKIDLEEFEKCL